MHPLFGPFRSAGTRDKLPYIMRVNFTAQPYQSQNSGSLARQVLLTVRPACGIPGDFSYTTDSSALLRMLRQKTELRSSVLERFQEDISAAKSARLLGVEMTHKALTEIGYFID